MLAMSQSVDATEREVFGAATRGAEVVKALAEAADRATSNPENFMVGVLLLVEGNDIES